MDAHLEKLQRALAQAIAGMSAKQLNWHPQEKWCAAEILEHLYLTYTGTVKGFELMLQKGGPQVSPATWRHRLRSWIVTGMGYLPAGRKAPQFAQPRGQLRQTAVGEFGAKIGEMDGIIARCEAQFGRRAKLLDHPILGPLTGTEWRKFHLVHGLHHAKQIRALRAGSQTARETSA
jgi:hypothetical protein